MPLRPLNQEHVNILLPTLNTGGAERIVLDTVAALPSETSARVLVLEDARTALEIPRSLHDRVQFELLGGRDWQEKLRIVTARVRASSNASIFVHMADPGVLSALHAAGIRTIPVVHNMYPHWSISATALNDPGVLFVVSVSQAIAREQCARGCRKRIVVIRHEIDRRDAEPLKADTRNVIRGRLKVSDDAVLVGMIGQFKAQKNYPRAVRILYRLLQHAPAKLVIVGGWDTNNATGRESYERTRCTAAALGIESEVITVGNVTDVTSYLSAFDVFLNTSSSEGLSISMLEARRTGCRIVASDVGGAREIKYAALHLVPPNSREDRFVKAILHCLSLKPPLPQASNNDGLIPFLWSAIGNYGWRPDAGMSRANVYLTSAYALHQVSKMLPASENGTDAHIGVYGDPPLDLQESLERRGVSIRRLPEGGGLVQQSASALQFIAAFNPSVVSIVGINVAVRMVLAKVLAPEIALVDADGPATLSKKLTEHKEVQHRICLDGSEYYARLHASWEGCNGETRTEGAQ